MEQMSTSQQQQDLNLLTKMLTHYNLFLSKGAYLYNNSSSVDRAKAFLEETMKESVEFKPTESRLFIKDLNCTPKVYTYAELKSIFNRQTEVLKKDTKLTHIFEALTELNPQQTLIGGRRRKTKRVSKRLRKSKKFHKRK
jgi:hypothetical protein